MADRGVGIIIFKQRCKSACMGEELSQLKNKNKRFNPWSGEFYR